MLNFILSLIITTIEGAKQAEVTMQSALSEFKKMTINDALSKIASDLINFCFRLAICILIFYVGKFIITRLHRSVKKIMLHRQMEPSLTTFILSLLKISLYFILIVTIIGILGVETSSLLAIFASAGVAIGMALSGTLQNFAGGVLILFLKPYRVGDFIEAQGYIGTVKEIQIFHTIINTIDNKAIIIPNGPLSTNSINNYSLEDYRRVDWTIGLEYGTDFEAAQNEILKILLSDERVIKKYIEDDSQYVKPIVTLPTASLIDRSPLVAIDCLADSSVNIVIKAWTHSSSYWPLYYEMNKRFYTELPKAGFSFPFPQMDVYVKQQ